MSKNASDDEINAKGDFLSRVTGVDPKTGQPTGIAAMMAQEGKRIKATDLLIDYAEDIGFTNADQYVENMPQQNPMEGGVDPNGQGGIDAGGAVNAQAIQGDMGNGGVSGFQGMVPAIPGVQAQPGVPGPLAV